MATTIAKLGQKITVATSANEKDVAAIVANAVGDNAKTDAKTLEGVILRAGSNYHDLLNAIRTCAHDQKEVQRRAFIAEWYQRDYMTKVQNGTVKEQRNAQGAVIIPPLTEKIRKEYGVLLDGANPDAKTLKEDQVRCTVEQWQRRSSLRTWWTRLLFAAGVKTVENRGGARVTQGETKTAEGATDPKLNTGNADPKTDSRTGRLPAKNDNGSWAMPAIVKAHTPQEAGSFLYALAATARQFITANTKGKTPTATAFQKEVNRFHEAIAKLSAKMDREAKAKK